MIKNNKIRGWIHGYTILLFLLFAVFGTACIKSVPEAKGTASLDILHAVIDGNVLRPNLKEEGMSIFRNSSYISYGDYYRGANHIGSYVGSTRLRLYEMPDTTDKDQPLYDLRLDLPEGSINFLVLCGTRNDPDYFLFRSEIPYFPDSDSVMAVRIINASPESNPVVLHLKNSGPIQGISPVSYREHSEFSTLPVLSNTRDYEFEVRDAVTGDLLATYTTSGMNQGRHSGFRYQSFSLLLLGKVGLSGTYQPKVTWVQH